jgi:hypothetical protein
MKYFLSVVILVFIYKNSIAQNAYYDAKKLAKWESLSDDDRMKLNEVLLIKRIIEKYFVNGIVPESSTFCLKLKNATNQIGIRSLTDRKKLKIINETIDNFINNHSNKRSTFSPLKRKNDELNGTNAIINSVSKYQRSLRKDVFNFNCMGDSLKTIFNELAVFIDSFNVIYQPLDLDTMHREVSDTLADSVICKYRDSSFTFLKYPKIRERLNTIESNLFQKKADLENTIISMFNLLEDADKISLAGNQFSQEQENKAKEIERADERKQEQLILNQATANESDPIIKSSISDQNFPSQSEIIDALAIYVAKRFKQEVALTFVENFTRYIKDNVFAKEIFPSTYNMLNNQDPYAVTKAGSEWRNAVSEDLIKLPQNLVNSTVVQKWINNPEAIEYLHDATLIGRYIAKKYSYVDMVRSLYEANGLEDEKNDVLKGSYIKKAILTSYIINQEFYDSSKAKYWITPEQLYKMNSLELQCLGELLATKYDSSFKVTFGVNPITKNTGYKKLQKQYTDLLALFKQFENGQVAAYLAREKGGNAKDAFWDFQRIFVDFLLKQIPDEKAKAMVRNVQKIFFVYDYVSNKNYGAVINSSLEILDTLMQQKSPTNYLRAFVNSDALAKVENLALSNLAIKMPDTKILMFLQQMEEYAKLNILIAKQDSNSPFIDTATLKKKFKEFFNTDTINITDENLQKLVKVALDSTVMKIWVEIDTLNVRLKRTYSNTADVKKILENLRFYTPKNYGDLKKYFPLAEKFILTKSPTLLTNFRKISGFLTDASTVKDSRELSKVLEAYAQPPLSYKLTRKSIFSIDVNSYLGFWGGGEFKLSKIDGNANNNFNKIKSSAGLTVPLGLNISWDRKRSSLKRIDKQIRYRKTDKRIFYVDTKGRPKFLTSVSHSVFVSIIDIAGPVSFRLGSDSAKGLPQNTRWSQVLAPGVHYILGLRNSPICFTAGFQITPQLRTYNDISSTPFSTGRFQLGLTYDMPLLNLLRKKPF